jgi:hypothetical protein
MEGHIIIVTHNQEPKRFEMREKGVATLQQMVRPEQDLGTARILERPMQSQMGQSF